MCTVASFAHLPATVASFDMGTAAYSPAFLIGLFVIRFACAWEALPQIPASRRTQYYLLHDDGAYKFGYDTGTGASHVAHADANNQVHGAYGYEGPDGPVHFRYTAGVGGFVPETTGESYLNAGGDLQRRVPAARGRALLSNTSPVQEAATGDASYAFNLDTDSYKRTESSDARGNVRSQYSYRGDDGSHVAVSYSSGTSSGLGAGDYSHQQVGDVVLSSRSSTDRKHASSNPISSSNPIVHHSFSAQKLTAPNTRLSAVKSTSNQQHAAIGLSSKSISSSSTPIVHHSSRKVASHTGTVGDVVSSSGPLADGSYAFSYHTSEQDRQEKADADGLVSGRYSYLAGDGIRRTVDYTAGANLGFVPHGAGIPPVPITKSAGSLSGDDDETWTPNQDASYSFSYATNEHSRQEASDPSGNVKGAYSYKAGDGVTRTVQYEAGAEKGFRSQETIGSGALASTGISHASVKTSEPPSDGSYALSYEVGGHGSRDRAAFSPAKTVQSKAALDGSYSLSYDVGGHRDVPSGSYSLFDNGSPYSRGTHTTPQAGGGYIAAWSTPDTWSGAATRHAAANKPTTRNGGFSYITQTDASKTAVHSTANGNVISSYSFQAGGEDGRTKSTNYVSGSARGVGAPVTSLPTSAHPSGNSWTRVSTPSGSWSWETPDPVPRAANLAASGGLAASAKSTGVFQQPQQNYVLHTFLPPESLHKFGYVYDTRF